jgi:glycosyltransferase involved in cell wall biosynthesis
MSAPDISVVVPVGDRRSDLEELHREYRSGLDALGASYEFVFVVDGHRPAASGALREVALRDDRVTVVTLSRQFGESTALMAGFQQSRGRIILTLPAYHQIEAAEIPTLVRSLDGVDLAVTERWPRAGGWLERLRRRFFHRLIAGVTGARFNDLGCSARAMQRRVLEEISLYGDQHRFLPLLADRQGFRVKEVRLRQSPRDRFEGHYRPREYAHRALDIFTVFFLVRFTKKPLRFFGMIGALTFGIGAVCTAWVVAERLIFNKPLAERPALLLSTLLLVLGLQLFALGLLGELIIFIHARQSKEYQVDEILQFPATRDREATARGPESTAAAVAGRATT